jgi:hypothetical protein
VNTAGTLSFNCVTLATGASLSGTTNTIPVFTAANAVGDSIITQNAGATLITVTGGLTVTGALTGTLATAVQPNITTAAGLVSVGTITTGVWNGTLIDLTRGGTGSNLAGTGGTGQFLKQNTVGGNVTVVRPAVADLSDAANVALLNADWSNTSAGGLTLDSAVGPLVFRTLGINGWTIDNEGGWRNTANALVDGVGTVSIASGFGTTPTIAGTVYSFTITLGATPGTTGVVDFNNTGTPFAQAPNCVPAANSTTVVNVTAITTSSVTLTYSGGTVTRIGVLCRGF